VVAVKVRGQTSGINAQVHVQEGWTLQQQTNSSTVPQVIQL
jgi:hypothetical protein